jgi:di/tricarboxylate transporter
MGRNRKNDASVQWGPAMKAAAICLLLGGSAVGYVLQKNKLHELGQQITRREAILAKLKWDNKLRATQLANLQLPRRIEERVNEQRLGLLRAPAVQVIWLPEPAAERTNEAPPLVVLDEKWEP